MRQAPEASKYQRQLVQQLRGAQQRAELLFRELPIAVAIVLFHRCFHDLCELHLAQLVAHQKAKHEEEVVDADVPVLVQIEDPKGQAGGLAGSALQQQQERTRD